MPSLVECYRVRLLVERSYRTGMVAALTLLALSLGGCALSIADLPLAGTPADAPTRSKETGAFIPVHDLPPDRTEAAMAPAEQAKMQSELVAARDRQASAAAAATAPNPAAK